MDAFLQVVHDPMFIFELDIASRSSCQCGCIFVQVHPCFSFVVIYFQL